MSVSGADVPGNPIEILLVDDNKHGLLARKLILEQFGYRTTLAGDPLEALSTFGDHRYDIVVTDYRMPHMTGVEFIQKLRELNHQMPVILVSGFVDVLGLTEENTGSNAVIQKSPNEVNQLLRAVGRLAKTARKPQQSAEGTPKKRRKKDVS